MKSTQNVVHKNIFDKKKSLALIRMDSGLDTLTWWLEQYLSHGVTTSKSLQQAQYKDIIHFIMFMLREEGTEDRPRWTPRLSRAFLDHFKGLINKQTGQPYSSRTISRTLAHLKTFAKWIHKLRPFPLDNPMTKVATTIPGTGLEIERALTSSERRRLLDAADMLPVTGGRSKDRGRYRGQGQERPQRKGYRPYRNRAIIYTLIETGMRRAGVCNILLEGVDFNRQTITTKEKGGHSHTYHVSREGLGAIRDYLEKERPQDNEKWQSAALFLAAAYNDRGKGGLSISMINKLWNDLCKTTGIENRTPHSARHAMGRHIVEKTGNLAAVQRQLGHKNAAYSMQYARIT
jgi:site-specific recombinase XerD